MFDDAHPEGSLPLKCLSITGESASSEDIEACVAGMEGLIIAFDNEGAFMPPSALKIFTDGSNLKHISLMSRTLNGGGMGFFPNAAKMAANAEIWAGTDALVAQFKKQDAEIRARASSWSQLHDHSRGDAQGRRISGRRDRRRQWRGGLP